MFKVAACAAPKGENRSEGRSEVAVCRATSAASSCDPIALGARRKVRKARPKGATPFGLRQNATIHHSTQRYKRNTYSRREAAPRWHKCDRFIYCRINLANALIERL